MSRKIEKSKTEKKKKIHRNERKGIPLLTNIFKGKLPWKQGHSTRKLTPVTNRKSKHTAEGVCLDY